MHTEIRQNVRVCVCAGVRRKIVDACVMDRGITRRGGETERERERVGEHR